MPDYKKPLPYIHEETKSFWEGTRRHELRLPKCLNCGRFHFYPRSICPYCFSSKLEWLKTDGKAKVYSFTVSHRAPSPGFGLEVPYNLAIVELEEGVRMMTNIIDCRNEDLKIGMPVEVAFDDITSEITLPKFRPAGDAW